MKKFTMLSSVLASALMLTVASCSSEDVAGGDAQNGKGTTSFLAVNIENVGSAPASRAYTQGTGSYEDGTTEESIINKVRFYFFNGDGTPYLLVNNDATQQTSVNYLEQTVETDGNDYDHTAEIKTKAVLVLKGETKAVPASVIAVINPAALDNSTLHSGTMTLSELRTSATGSKFNDKIEGFVMSNSVYESAGQDVCSTPVANSVFDTADKALSKPVDIYVERVNAKVNAKIDANYKRDGETENAWIQNEEGKYQIKVGSIDVITYDETDNAAPTKTTYPVYAVVQGWQLADANGKAELCKQINTSWYAGELGISPWTTSDYHRCFWSESVPFTSGAQAGANHPLNPTFKGITQSLSEVFSAEPVYTLPNTPDKVVTNPTTSVNTLTKLIVAAKLVYKDKNGEYHPAQVCQYRGLTYLGEEAVKKQIVGGFARYFKKTTTESGDVYKSIEASDIAFKTVVPGSPESSEVKNYEVVATLASTVGDLYVKNGDAWTIAPKDDVNAALAKETAQVRSTDGATYYYTPIKHLGEAGKLGEYGIVRNHSYQVTIQNIKGFGTPVYDPNKEIDPMIPSDENTYLAASIKVLSWRVVSSTVDLDQTK
ncbi:Mfa1 family fimbria major subunit [Segatella copri]|uniref:Mfa1 family fimbria major subunit n=1 Tax=Segatella copri TaxID=165179 RepID=UPI003F970327